MPLIPNSHLSETFAQSDAVNVPRLTDGMSAQPARKGVNIPMSDGLTCPRCRRISALPSRADRETGRGYTCRFCGTVLFPAPSPRIAETLLVGGLAGLARVSGPQGA